MQEPAPAGVPEPRPSLLALLRDRDHTRGSVTVSILVLALPSILTSVAGMGVFQLVDLLFLKTLGSAAQAAAGATNQTLRQGVFLLVLGLSAASQMMIGRLVGQRGTDRAAHVAGQALLLGLALSAVAAVIGALFARPLIELVAHPDAVGPGVIYMRIAFLTLATTICLQLLSAVLNGAGDTTTPMLVTLVVAPVSITSEWILAFGHLGLPPLGIAGIALGAALGAACGCGVLLWALFAGRCRVHLRAGHLVPDGALLRRILSVAWQPACHMIARTSMVFFFMWLAGRLGRDVQAAYTVGLRLEMLAIMIAFPIGNACATLVSQNVGAGSVPRAWRAIFGGCATELALIWPAALALFAFRGTLAAAFSETPEVAALAAEYLAYASAILAFYGIYFVAFRALQAAGDMNSPFVISIGAALGVGVPLAYYLATRAGLGATGMWIGYLGYTSTNTVLTAGWLLLGRWTRAARATPPVDLEPVATR